MQITKKGCRDGVTCVVLCVACTLPSIYMYMYMYMYMYLVCGFWHCHPYILGKCFSYLSSFIMQNILWYMRKGLGIFLENCEKPAATQD